MAIVVFFLISCSYPVPKRLKRELNCYADSYTGLDTLINTHGYYSRMVVHDHTGLSGMKDGKFQPLGIDTSYYDFLFFNDGVFIGNVGASGMTISEYLNRMATIGESFDDRSFYQGTYSVVGDTIKVQFISPGYANTWAGFEVWYRIIDKNTLVDFYSKNLGLLRSDRNKLAYKSKLYSNSNPSNFVYVPNMPKSSSWLKKERWFYCE